MSYSIIPARDGGEPILVENPDPALMTREAREDLLRRVHEVRAAILERRGGVPIDVEGLLDEMRAERGLRFLDPGAESEPAARGEDISTPPEPPGPAQASPDDAARDDGESAKLRDVSYSIVRSANGDPDMLIEDPDPALTTREARLALLREFESIREAILKRRKGVGIDVDAIVDEMRSDRGENRS